MMWVEVIVCNISVVILRHSIFTYILGMLHLCYEVDDVFL